MPVLRTLYIGKYYRRVKNSRVFQRNTKNPVYRIRKPIYNRAYWTGGNFPPRFVRPAQHRPRTFRERSDELGGLPPRATHRPNITFSVDFVTLEKQKPANKQQNTDTLPTPPSRPRSNIPPSSSKRPPGIFMYTDQPVFGLSGRRTSGNRFRALGNPTSGLRVLQNRIPRARVKTRNRFSYAFFLPVRAIRFRQSRFQIPFRFKVQDV